MGRDETHLIQIRSRRDVQPQAGAPACTDPKKHERPRREGAPCDRGSIVSYESNSDNKNCALTVTVFPEGGRKNPQGQSRTVPAFRTFFEKFCEAAKAPTRAKHDLPMWTAAQLAGDYADSGNFLAMTAIVRDIDNTERVEDVSQPLPADRQTTIEKYLAAHAGQQVAIYTSYSHAPEQPRFRAVHALTRPMSANEARRILHHEAARLEEQGIAVDECSLKLVQRWFVPSRTEHYECRYQDGAPLDIDAMLAALPASTATEPEKRSETTRLWQWVRDCEDRIEMRDLLEADGIAVTRGKCALREERTPSCRVYEHHLHDYGDGTHLTIYGYLRQRRGLEHWDALEKIAELAGVEVIDRDVADRPAIIDPQDEFDALPAELPELGREKVLRNVCRAMATLDKADRDVWIERVVERYAGQPKIKKPDLRSSIKKIVREQIEAADEERDAAQNAALLAASSASPTGYVIEGGAHAVVLPIGVQPLCNFTAQIRRTMLRETPSGDVRVHEIAGYLSDGTPLRTIEVPADDFAAMRWVESHWAPAARVNARTGKAGRDLLREAVQVNSPIAPEERVHTSTGWTTIDGRRRYVHAGGAVSHGDERRMTILGDKKLVAVTDTPRVDIDTKAIALPMGDASPAQIRESAERQIAFLDVAPRKITIPLHGMACLAPLLDVLKGDFTVAVIGEPEAMKSSLSVEVQRRFGDHVREVKDLPATFRDTSTAIEGVLYTAKDALVVIDDYCPKGSPREADRQRAVLENLVRDVGNRATRRRATASLHAATYRPPRAAVIVTAEEDPSDTTSIANRICKVLLRKGDVDTGRLGALQRGGDTSTAQRAYIEWIAAHGTDHLRDQYLATLDELRIEAEAKGLKARQPDILAQLMVAIDLHVRFTVWVGALTTARAAALREEARAALLDTAAEQAEDDREARPSARYVEAVRALLTSGRCKLVTRDKTLAEESSPTCAAIGWEHDGAVYLEPAITLKYVIAHLRDVGTPLTVREATIRADLERHFGLVRDGKQLTRKVSLGTGRPRVLQMQAEHFRDEAMSEDDAKAIAKEAYERHATPEDVAENLVRVEGEVTRWTVLRIETVKQGLKLRVRSMTTGTWAWVQVRHDDPQMKIVREGDVVEGRAYKMVDGETRVRVSSWDEEVA